MTYRVFIVDDEAMARGNLVDGLQTHPRWSDVRTYASGGELVAEAIQHRPQVVFLDIEMPGEDGLSIARKLLELRPAPLIVFVTAYSEHAVAAFELYAVDYLLKPFDDERLAQCLARLESTLENQAAMRQAHDAQSTWADDTALKRLVIKSSASIRVIEVDQIRWIAANGNYVDIHHDDGKHLLRASMKHVLSKLPPDVFVQIHRGFAVRFELIRELTNQDNDRAVTTLTTGETLPVGKSFRQSLLDRLYQ